MDTLAPHATVLTQLLFLGESLKSLNFIQNFKKSMQIYSPHKLTMTLYDHIYLQVNSQSTSKSQG